MAQVLKDKKRDPDYVRDYENCRRFCPNGPKYEIFENYDMKVRVHGDTAIVNGKTHTKGISGGKPFDSKFQFNDTFVKDGGRWRLLAGHVSKLPAKEK